MIALAIDTRPTLAYGWSGQGREQVKRDAAQAGREAEFQRLYQETGHLVFRRVVRMLGEPADAMDVTQETYLAAWQKGFALRSRGEALAWLYRTATRRALTLLRNRGTRARLRHRHGPELRGTPPPLPDAGPVARQLVHRALESIDARSGEIALLTHLGGFSVERAAELTGASLRTVARARRRFEAALAAVQKEVES